MSDVQKILSIAFKIFWAKNPRHFFTFIAQLQQVLNWEDRQEELMALSSVAYNLLQDAILDQVIGKHAKACDVTKDFIDSIKAKAPTNMEELFDTIAAEGESLHQFALRAERMSIPFLPFTKQKEGGNFPTTKDPLKSKDLVAKGGGNARKTCTTCGKLHEGVCRFTQKSGGGASSSSSSTVTPGKFDKYKSPRDQGGGKTKSKLNALPLSNDIEILQQEATLNKLSESAYACQYPMKIYTSNGKFIDIIALIDTGANASNYISQILFDRLSEAGCKAHEASGSVRGGLNLKGQRVDCTKSMSFPLQFISE